MILDLFQLGESTTHIQHQKADLFKSFEKFIQILSEYPSAKTSILESYGVPFDKLFVSHPGYKNFLTERHPTYNWLYFYYLLVQEVKEQLQTSK